MARRCWTWVAGAVLLRRTMAAQGAEVTGIDLGIEALQYRPPCSQGRTEIDYQQKAVEDLAASGAEPTIWGFMEP